MTEQELERIVQQLRQEFLGLRLQLPAVLSKKRAAEAFADVAAGPFFSRLFHHHIITTHKTHKEKANV